MPRKLKPGGGRNKGKRGERAIVQFFNTWFGRESDNGFHRTPASGGLQWRKDNRVAGDIVPPVDLAGNFRFCIEVKNVSTLEFGALLDHTSRSQSCNILDYWSQACDQAAKTDLEPMLFMRDARCGKGKFYVAIWFSSFDEPTSKATVSVDVCKLVFDRPNYGELIIMSSDDLSEEFDSSFMLR